MKDRRMNRFPVRPLRALALIAALLPGAAAADDAPLIIGLNADLSSASALAGEAIHRGAAVAIAEINAAGGLLGRRLELVARDHRGIPARGRDNIEAFAAMPNLLAVMGGAHTPVVLDQLEDIHLHRIIFLIPWAAGTTLVDNGHNPNFVFRVSVRDEFAGAFLVDKAEAEGYQMPGLLLERTAWGRSNERAMIAALNRTPALRLTRTEWLNRGVQSLDDAVDRLAAAGTDVVLMAAGARESAMLIKAMAARSEAQRLPIISHWGIASGDFAAAAGPAVQGIDLRVLQTFLFARPPFPERAARFFATYRRLFADATSPEAIRSPAGMAHAYDLIRLLAMAVRKTDTTDRLTIRNAMEALGRHQGLVRNYDPPFTAERHDALTAGDYRMARFTADGRIVPEGP